MSSSKPDRAKLDAQAKRKNRVATKKEITRILHILHEMDDSYSDFSKSDVKALLGVLRRYVLNVGGDLPWPPSVAAWTAAEQVNHKALYYSFAASEGIEDVVDGIKG